jgi:hypothetical protein
MKLIANTFIFTGISSVILASMMVDEVYAPMTDDEFMVQVALIIFGMGIAFVGGLMRIMSE